MSTQTLAGEYKHSRGSGKQVIKAQYLKKEKQKIQIGEMREKLVISSSPVTLKRIMPTAFQSLSFVDKFLLEVEQTKVIRLFAMINAFKVFFSLPTPFVSFSPLFMLVSVLFNLIVSSIFAHSRRDAIAQHFRRG